MTNPTSNFGWQMPTSTDLVTDLPADFEVFGQAVDTSLADLKGGTTGQVLSKTTNADMDFTWVALDDTNAIQNAIVDAKGDLITATAADTPARLAVGTNGQFLKADSTTATGLAWGSVAATKNYSLIGTGTLTSGSTVTVSGISNMDDILVVINKASNTAGNTQVNLQINGDTASNYTQGYVIISAPASYANTFMGSNFLTNTRILLGNINSDATDTLSGSVMIHGCATSGVKAFQSASSGGSALGNNAYAYINGGFWNNSAAITSISLVSSGTFDAGSFSVYGAA